MRTPIDAIPDLSENQVIVFTDWAGRSPQEVEDQITYPLTVNPQGLAGIKTVRSSSAFGFSMINLIFEGSVDLYFARARVLEKLNLSSGILPEGVTPVLGPDATGVGQVYWYTVDGPHDPGTLHSLQHWFIRYQLNSVPPDAALVSRKVFTPSSSRVVSAPAGIGVGSPLAAASNPFISSRAFFSATSPSQVSAATR